MKQTKEVLDVDFIGGNGPLTTAEELAISTYLQNRRNTGGKSTKKSKRPSLKTTNSKKSLA